VEGWQETAQIFARMADLAAAGERSAVATVVRIQGSAYRRPGAKFLVEGNGSTVGSVSGGCLEADVREVAWATIREGRARLCHYETGEESNRVWGLGLGCNGSVDVFVQPENTMADTARILQLLDGETAFAVSTIVKGTSQVGRMLVVTAGNALGGPRGDDGPDQELTQRTIHFLANGKSQLHEIASLQVFTEIYTPPPHLIVCGAGDDSIPLVAYASDAGFRVTVVDHRSAFLSKQRFRGARRLLQLRPEDNLSALPLGPRTYVVVKMHSLAHDREWIRHLLPTEVPYLGLLGPRARKEVILRDIGMVAADRVFGPVGLDLGAEGPTQVALSVLAELLAVRAAREPGHLCEKEGPIHAT
jgi:xanthine/CO dehydrogenase XdhC/CoxF family maturation factor